MLPRPFPFPFFGEQGAPPPAPRGVFYPRSLACGPHRLNPSPLASGTRPASPGLQSSFSFPAPGSAARTVFAPPSWHWEQDPPPPAPRGVFFPRSWPNDPHRLNPSPLASGTGFSPRKVFSRSLGRLPVSCSPSWWASLCPFSCHAKIPWGISPGDLFRSG